MSVDDILNLRAGEPTTFFHARNVTDRADALHQAERQTFTPDACRQAGTRRCIPLGLLGSGNRRGRGQARDLFTDAAAQAEAEAEIEADAADSADAAATDAEVAAVSTETAARPLEASHDGNKNNLIPVDKLFSARPSTPIAVALPTGTTLAITQATLTRLTMRLTRPPRNRRSPPNNRRWRNSPHRKLPNSSPPNSSRSRCTLRSRRRNSRQRWPRKTTTSGSAAKQPIAARTGRNRRIQADLRTGIGIRPCVQGRPRQAGADHRGRRPDLR